MKRTLLLSLCCLLIAGAATAQPTLRRSLKGACPTDAALTRRYNLLSRTPVEWNGLALSTDNLRDAAQRAKQKKTNYAYSYTWTSIGTATYREDVLTAIFSSLENVVYEVEMEEAEEVPGYYRLVYPYGAAYPYNSEGDYDADSTYYMYIDATDEDYVYIHYTDQGIDWGYGSYIIGSYMGYFIDQGNYSLAWLKSGYAENFGTLSEGIITMPAYGMLIYEPDYEGESALYYANLNGLFAIALPGYTLEDYSLDFSYTGQTTNSFGKEFATGELTIGDDVAYVTYATCDDEDDIQSVYSGMLDGSVSTKTLTTGGTVSISMTETCNSYIILIAYDADDTAQTAMYCLLPFVSTYDTWTQEDTGTFNYYVSDPASLGYWYSGTESTVLYRNDSHDEYFKILPWGNSSTGLIFTWDYAADDVHVYYSETGDTYSGYGAVVVSDYAVYMGSEGVYDCYYDAVSGKLHFFTFYYVTAGYLTMVESTFALDNPSAILSIDADAADAQTGVYVYDTAGRLLSTAPADTFDPQSLPGGKGVLLLRSGGQTQKVVK